MLSTSGIQQGRSNVIFVNVSHRIVVSVLQGDSPLLAVIKQAAMLGEAYMART